MGLIYSCGIMLIGILILEGFGILFAGANVALQGIFQALNSGGESLLISVCRQALFILPTAYGFSVFALTDHTKTWMVWLSFPIAEFASMCIGILLLIRVLKKNKIG